MRPCASITLTAGFTYLPSAQVLCHVVPMIMAVSVYVSTLTSMAIAVDRYFAIVHPLRARLALHASRSSPGSRPARPPHVARLSAGDRRSTPTAYV